MALWKSGKKQEREIAAFWSDLEDELGERIIARSIGEYFSGFEGIKGPLWGLFFITESSFYFRHFNQPNWFSAVIQASGSSVGNGELFISIPRKDILEAGTVKSASFLSRLIAPPQPVLVLEYKDATRVRRDLRIRLEQNREIFFSELNAAR